VLPEVVTPVTEDAVSEDVVPPVVEVTPEPPAQSAVEQPVDAGPHDLPLVAGERTESPDAVARTAGAPVTDSTTAASSGPPADTTGDLPPAPGGAPAPLPAATSPGTGFPAAPTGSDGGPADLPDSTLRTALSAAGTSEGAARRAAGTVAFDPSFSPD
jgi:hypothetical protein